MTVKDMQKITQKAKEEAERQEEEEKRQADLKQRKAQEAEKHWWLDKGIPKILDNIKCAAKRGEDTYEEVIDCCPDYVVERLEKEGFTINLTTEKRGVRLGRGDGDSWECYYAHVLVVKW